LTDGVQHFVIYMQKDIKLRMQPGDTGINTTLSRHLVTKQVETNRSHQKAKN